MNTLTTKAIHGERAIPVTDRASTVAIELGCIRLNLGSICDIFMAARLGDEDRVAELLHGNPALARTFDEGGRTALHHATCGGRIEVMEILLAYGADIDATDRMNQTALHRAAGSGTDEMVTFLLSRGSDANRKDIWRKTALERALTAGRRESAKALRSRMTKDSAIRRG